MNIIWGDLNPTLDPPARLSITAFSVVSAKSKKTWRKGGRVRTLFPPLLAHLWVQPSNSGEGENVPKKKKQNGGQEK